MRAIITLITVLVIGLYALTHEGHDKMPGNLAAPHGGQLKGTSQLFIEIVSDISGFKIYTFDHDLKAIPIKEVKIEATVKLPKLKKSEKLALSVSESFLETKIDAKGSHRYMIELKVTYKGKTETVSFNVEPQE